MWQKKPKAAYLRQTDCLQPDNAEQHLAVANNWCHAVRICETLQADVSLTSEPFSVEMLPTLYIMAGLFNSILKNILQGKQEQKINQKREQVMTSVCQGKEQVVV